MINRPMTRRTVAGFVANMTVAAALSIGSGWAVEKSVTVGLDLSLTGADAESAKRIEYCTLMAFDEVNAKGGVNSYKIVTTPYDDGDLRQYHYIGVAPSA